MGGWEVYRAGAVGTDVGVVEVIDEAEDSGAENPCSCRVLAARFSCGSKQVLGIRYCIVKENEKTQRRRAVSRRNEAPEGGAQGH